MLPSREHGTSPVLAGIGKSFGEEYTIDLKKKMMAAGKVSPTGCPESLAGLL